MWRGGSGPIAGSSARPMDIQGFNPFPGVPAFSTPEPCHLPGASTSSPPLATSPSPLPLPEQKYPQGRRVTAAASAAVARRSRSFGRSTPSAVDASLDTSATMVPANRPKATKIAEPAVPVTSGVPCNSLNFHRLWAGTPRASSVSSHVPDEQRSARTARLRRAAPRSHWTPSTSRGADECARK
jgi:hypothetical protein